MKHNHFLVICFCCVFLCSCDTTAQILKSYRKNNSFYIENIDSEGKAAYFQTIYFKNVTFFQLDFNILGIENISKEPVLLYSGTIDMRTIYSLDVKKILNKAKDNQVEIKYLCVNVLNGNLKKCSAYSKDTDLYIDIESYENEIPVAPNVIDEELLIELEKVFGNTQFDD